MTEQQKKAKELIKKFKPLLRPLSDLTKEIKNGK